MTPNTLLSPPTTGTAPRVGAVPPDPFDGQRHQVRSDGRVVRRGTAYVHASDSSLTWDLNAPLAHLVSPQREVFSEMIETVTAPRHGARGGTHALDLQRIADSILMGTGTPRLVGTDAMSWEEVVRVPRDATVQDVQAALAVAHLNYTDPWDAAREVFGIPRPNIASAIACEHQMIVRPSVTKGGPRRRSVTMGRTRAGDPTDQLTTPRESAPSYCHAFGVMALVAPAADREHRWVGHVLVTRPPVHRRRRAASRTTLRKARTVTLATVDAATDFADGLAPGTRARFACGTVSGTVSRAAGGAWSVRVKREDTGKVVTRSTLRQARYVRNVIANASR